MHAPLLAAGLRGRKLDSVLNQYREQLAQQRESF